MNKKYILGIFGLLFLLVFIACDLEPEKTYLVRGGGQRVGGGTFETGVFVSPAGALVPFLIEDDRARYTLSEFESLLNRLGFNQSWIQSARNNLNRDGSAFIIFVNTERYFRWLWITDD